MEPQTWKDILKSNAKNDSEDSLGHSWNITGSSGGERFSVRRIDRRMAGFQTSSRIMYYKCSKCGITAQKRVGEDIVVDKQIYSGLTCDEVIIKDIID